MKPRREGAARVIAPLLGRLNKHGARDERYWFTREVKTALFLVPDGGAGPLGLAKLGFCRHGEQFPLIAKRILPLKHAVRQEKSKCRLARPSKDETFWQTGRLPR